MPDPTLTEALIDGAEPFPEGGSAECDSLCEEYVTAQELYSETTDRKQQLRLLARMRSLRSRMRVLGCKLCQIP